MKLLLLIALFILGSGFLGKLKSNRQEIESEGEATPPRKTKATAFESLFEESDSQAQPSSFEDEERAAGYFSYETINTAAAVGQPMGNVAMNVGETRADNEALVSTEQLASNDFDLRQAVIYHTILYNKYLPEPQL